MVTFTRDRARGNGLKLKDNQFRLDIRKRDYAFVLRVMKHWNRVPGEVVDAFSFETFKVSLGGALI